MARPAKKKSAAKKPAAKAAKKPTRAAKSGAKAAAPRATASSEPSGVTPYTPKPIEGIGWPAFRYPLT
jgi:hypothetical protein